MREATQTIYQIILSLCLCISGPVFAGGSSGASSGGGGGGGGGNVPPPRPAPSAVYVPSNDTDGAYSISWSSVAGVANYEVIEQHNGGSWTSAGGTGPSSTSLNYSGKADGTYRYAVRTVDGYEQRSGFRYSTTFTVARPPGVPSSISVPSGVTGVPYTISWGVAGGSVTNYQYRLYNGNWTSTGLNRSATLYSQSDGNYRYQVRACNSLGSCSSTRTSAYINVLNAPSAPGSVSVPSTTEGHFNFSWTDATGSVSHYQYAISSNGGSSYGNWLNKPTSDKSGSQNSASDGQYRIKVKACNAAGCGAEQYSQVFTVLNRPGIPSNMHYEWVIDASSSGGGGGGSGGASPDDTPDSYRLHWNTPSGQWDRIELDSQSNHGSGFTDWTTIYNGPNQQHLRANQQNGMNRP